MSRSHRRIRKIREQYHREQPQPCARCGQPINYDAEPNDPDAFNLGHIKSWAHYPELRYDPANMVQEHRACNLAAGTDDYTGPTSLGLRSRDW